MPPFHDLDSQALQGLAAGLRRGGLVAPTPATLRPYCPPELLTPVADALRHYGERGFTSSQLADLLELLRDDRQHAQRTEPKLDLVWTGPDPEKFTDRDAAVVVMDLFQSVERSLILTSYVIFNGSDLFAPLHRRMVEVPDLVVRLFIDLPRPQGDSRAAAAIVSEFKEDFRHKHWPWDLLPEVFYDPRSLSTDKATQATLHAKVVVADDHTTLITSANLTPRAQNKNIEAGVRIESPLFARTVSQQFHGLIEQELVHPIHW